MRRTSDLVSEMTSQVRCGEAVELLEKKAFMWRAQVQTDGYEGWIDSRQFTKPVDSPPLVATVISEDFCCEATFGKDRLHLPLGTPLLEFSDGAFFLDGHHWNFHGRTRTIPDSPPSVDEVLAYASRYLLTPYLWGGRTAFGIDCSGFTQAVMRAHGIPLLRDTTEQILQGTSVADAASARPGDLLFFQGTTNHVGLLLPDNKVIHASAMVRIDHFSEAGITHQETGSLTHQLTEIRRVLTNG